MALISTRLYISLKPMFMVTYPKCYCLRCRMLHQLILNHSAGAWGCKGSDGRSWNSLMSWSWECGYILDIRKSTCAAYPSPRGNCPVDLSALWTLNHPFCRVKRQLSCTIILSIVKRVVWVLIVNFNSLCTKTCIYIQLLACTLPVSRMCFFRLLRHRNPHKLTIETATSSTTAPTTIHTMVKVTVGSVGFTAGVTSAVMQ